MSRRSSWLQADRSPEKPRSKKKNRDENVNLRTLTDFSTRSSHFNLMGIKIPNIKETIEQRC